MCPHLVEFLDIPPRPDQVFRLDLAGANLPILRALLDIRDELLLLVLQLDPFPVKFALSLFEGALVFAKALGGRHSLAKGPFYYLVDQSQWGYRSSRAVIRLTFMTAASWGQVEFGTESGEGCLSCE